MGAGFEMVTARGKAESKVSVSRLNRLSVVRLREALDCSSIDFWPPVNDDSSLFFFVYIKLQQTQYPYKGIVLRIDTAGYTA